MAANAAAVWECRASGVGVSDNNGGAYAPIRVSTFSGTDLAVDATLNTKVTSVTHNFVAADVGTRLQISAGTGWTTGFYTILSVAANAATLDSSPAATSATGGTWTEVGKDFANQLAPQVAVGGGVVTSSVTTNVITFTGGTYTPTNADVGNHVQVISGTNTTPGTILHITATTSTTWTMDANVVSAGTATNVVANMGGALLTLGQLAAKMVGQNKAYCTGAFTSTATITFAQAGSGAGAAGLTRIIGYGAVRGDATHATLTLGTNTGLIGLQANATAISFEQMDVDCANLGTSTGIGGAVTNSTFFQVINCKVSNFTSDGIVTLAATAFVARCEVTGGGAAAAAGIRLAQTRQAAIECFVHDNACAGITLTGSGQNCHVVRNLVANNSGAASDGIIMNVGAIILGNTVHNNGRDGLRMTSNLTGMVVLNNLLTNNAGSGINNSGVALNAFPLIDGNAYFGNALTRTNLDAVSSYYGVSPYANTHDVILTASPYVGPTTGTTANFALNNTASAGAACRAVGTPSLWAGNTGTTGYPDLGAVQTRGSSTSPSAGGPPGIIVAA